MELVYLHLLFNITMNLYRSNCTTNHDRSDCIFLTWQTIELGNLFITVKPQIFNMMVISDSYCCILVTKPYILLSICKHHYFCFSLLILTKTNPDLNTKQIVLVIRLTPKLHVQIIKMNVTRYFIKLQRDPHVWLSRCHLQSCNVWQTATQTDNRSPAHVYLGQSYLQLPCLTFMQISTHRFYSDILHDFSKQSTKIVTILTFRR